MVEGGEEEEGWTRAERSGGASGSVGSPSYVPLVKFFMASALVEKGGLPPTRLSSVPPTSVVVEYFSKTGG